MSQFEAIVKRQRDIQHRISRVLDNLRKMGKDKITKYVLDARVETLEASWQRFIDNHELLTDGEEEEVRASEYFIVDLYTECEDAYIVAKAELNQWRASLTGGDARSRASTGQHLDGSVLPGNTRALPKISIPKFSGEYQTWPPFRDLFLSMVGENADLQPVEKLHYLKTHVSGEAARLISTVPVTSDNFVRAWEMLFSRYQNKRLLINAYFDRLFSVTPLTRKSANDLKDLLAAVTEALGGLTALGAPTTAWDLFLVYFVSRRLDADSREAWELQQGRSTDPATFQEFEEFLDGRMRGLEMLSGSVTNKPPRPSHTKSAAKVNAAACVGSKCSLCSGAHYLAFCPDFTGKSISERRDYLNTKRLCYNCLGAHRLRECRTTKRCRVCHGHHHTLIHRDANRSSSASTPGLTNASAADRATGADDTSSVTVGGAHALLASSIPAGRPLTVLATARVRLLARDGRRVEGRALLDQGSELSFVRESLAQLLGLPRLRGRIPILGIGSQPSGTTRGLLQLRLLSCADRDFSCDVSAYVLPRLTGCLPSRTVAPAVRAEFDGLRLADPQFWRPGSIDLVLGADVYGRLLRGDLRGGGPGALTAQDTHLGWVISGPTADGSTFSGPAAARHAFSGEADRELHHLLSQFWQQEEVDVGRPRLTGAELECEAHFQRTHSRGSAGRYVVRLPLRVSADSLGWSRAAAERSLRRLQTRLDSSAELSRLYIEFLSEYESLGHMAEVRPSAEPATPSFFLPHHGVFRGDTAAAKLRVVFNGSARTTSGLSLNDCLHPGPKLQLELADVLLRWRFHAVAFLADIEKMYRQIEVHPDDRVLQQILWSRCGAAKQYQLCTVTYGLSCAPFLALRVLQQLVKDEGARFPRAIAIVRGEMYMDDVLSGADDLSGARAGAAQLTGLLMAGGFRLHKWSSNSRDLLSAMHVAALDPVTVRELAPEAPTRALGMVWDPLGDRFLFQINLTEIAAPPTKRVVLSRISRLFDPLGVITPILITAKIFIQGLWRLRVGWDDPLPPPWAQRWALYESELRAVSELSLPRWLGGRRDSEMELHGFSDASQDALGAAVYLRTLLEDGSVCVVLVAGRSKVAPLKKLTIPRLELSAAVLATRLLYRVRRVLALGGVPVHLWTDSSVVLAWVSGHPSQWKEFVANRVATIQEMAEGAHWHHVAGVDNPADCASRGLSPGELSTHSLWWRGPSWLSSTASYWEETLPQLEPGADLEKRAQVHLVGVEPPGPLWELIFRYSRLPRLIRITAWLFRAVALWRRRPSSDIGILSLLELADAERFWVRRTQCAHFRREISLLSRNAPLPRAHPLLRLTPYIDQEGILRLGGRLRNAQLDPGAQHPILLPRDAYFTLLVIDDVHRRTLHGGVQLMLSTLRRTYWILGGRAPVSAFIRRCVTCARYRAVAARELMGQLPPSRVTAARPFLNSGVDYAGPFLLKTWRGRSTRRYKGFLILFICMATSAVHLELATDYSTSGFLAAYRRFCARRGVCATLTSDCGSNLVGADAELRRLFASCAKEMGEMANLLASDGTKWKFNPPAAPHFGGKWEAAVKSVKFHLRRIIGETSLTYEEFTTVLAQVEAVLNSRPLCAISDDPADTEALTPAHFLIGEPLTMIPEPTLKDLPMNRLSRWQYLRQMVERLWVRWSREYLQRLQDVSKWQRPGRPIQVGALVLIRDERYPPAKWPLARVVEAHEGADGLVRVVTVRTASSTYKRPIVKLIPLPVAL